jgi:hypothetical protein
MASVREDIIKIIKSSKDVTNVLILTHNIDFLFVQSIVIPALRKCGSPALTIFADADCAAQTYQYQSGRSTTCSADRYGVNFRRSARDGFSRELRTYSSLF